MFLGDSITEWLYMGPGKPCWDMFFAPLGAIDFAAGGATTSQVLWQVEQGQVEAATPRVVVLMIGTNNLTLGATPEGTAKGVTKIVDDFADAVMKDPKINFLRDPEKKLTPEQATTAKKHMVDFLSSLSGGPLKYTGKSMKEVHKGMGITDEEFNATAEQFKSARAGAAA